jgi:hypothetical protein
MKPRTLLVFPTPPPCPTAGVPAYLTKEPVGKNVLLSNVPAAAAAQIACPCNTALQPVWPPEGGRKGGEAAAARALNFRGYVNHSFLAKAAAASTAARLSGLLLRSAFFWRRRSGQSIRCTAFSFWHIETWTTKFVETAELREAAFCCCCCCTAHWLLTPRTHLDHKAVYYLAGCCDATRENEMAQETEIIFRSLCISPPRFVPRERAN